MAQKKEIDSYETLYYWIDSMVHKRVSSRQSVKGLKRLKDFVQDCQSNGWAWKDIAEWATYNTATQSGFNPIQDTEAR